MSRVARYLTHPEVIIDPAKPVPEWGISPVGKARIEKLIASKVFVGTTLIVSSAEQKAVETAEPIATSLGLSVDIRPKMHENDRSATGYLPKQAFEEIANRFFAEPMESVRGWERAIDAQARIVAEVNDALRHPTDGDILFVGHGGVGTLLRCWLADLPIDRRFDQHGGGGGCMFTFDLANRKPLSGWQLIEDLWEVRNLESAAL